jgi:hypothetical protein
VRGIQIHAGLSWFSIFQKVPAPCQILLLAGILTFEMRGWVSFARAILVKTVIDYRVWRFGVVRLRMVKA